MTYDLIDKRNLRSFGADIDDERLAEEYANYRAAFLSTRAGGQLPLATLLELAVRQRSRGVVAQPSPSETSEDEDDQPTPQPPMPKKRGRPRKAVEVS